MPFPLPDAAPYNTALRWFLVAVPDEPEFVEAALGAYTELGKFYNWGLEGPSKPNSNDAANLFNEAILATLEAWEQNMLQQLIDAVDQVEPKLDALLTCCNPTGGVFQIPSVPPPATVGDITVWPIGNPDTQPPAPADIVSPVGGVSTSYPTIPDYDSNGTIGETEFFDYRCAGSTFVLDTIINLLRWTAKAKRLVGDVADILSDLAFHIAGHYASGTPLGNILTILDMTGAATWPTLLNAATATNLEAAADQVEAVKDTIRQELACGATAAGALTILQAALQGTITDAAALAFLSGSGILGFLVSMLWTAAFDTGWSAACSCVPAPPNDWYWDYSPVLSNAGAVNNGSIVVDPDGDRVTITGNALNGGGVYLINTPNPGNEVVLAIVLDVESNTGLDYYGSKFGANSQLIDVQANRYIIADNMGAARGADVRAYLNSLGYTDSGLVGNDWNTSGSVANGALAYHAAPDTVVFKNHRVLYDPDYLTP